MSSLPPNESRYYKLHPDLSGLINLFSNFVVQWTSCQETSDTWAVLRLSHIKTKITQGWELQPQHIVCVCTACVWVSIFVGGPVVAYDHELVIPPCLPSRGIHSVRAQVCLQTWQQQWDRDKGLFFSCRAAKWQRWEQNVLHVLSSSNQVKNIKKKIHWMSSYRDKLLKVHMTHARILFYLVFFFFLSLLVLCLLWQASSLSANAVAPPPRQRERRRLWASWMSAGEGSSSPNSTTTHRDDWQPKRTISRFLQWSTKWCVHQFVKKKIKKSYGMSWCQSVLLCIFEILAPFWIFLHQMLHTMWCEHDAKNVFYYLFNDTMLEKRELMFVLSVYLYSKPLKNTG